ncbi:cytochrome c3 family protein [Acidobacteriota bacterium]
MKKTVIVFLLPLFLLSSKLFSQECITSECHAKFSKMKLLHGPVADDCTTCHIQTGKHKFKFADNDQGCLQCHDNQEEGTVVHQAMGKEKCQSCHDPHGGNDRSFIKTDRMDTLCFECHDSGMMSKKAIHGPMATGSCSMCHDPHSSDNPSLLKASSARICIRCHTDKDYSGENMHMHTPLQDGCDGCHDSHSSDNTYQLVTEAGNLCEKCHDDLFKEATDAGSKHPIVLQDKKCDNCHDPHGSLFEHNLRRDQLSLCLGCHNKSIIGTDGKDYNVYQIVTKNPNKHGPVADGNCTGCHDPHGSNSYKILIKDYPQEFYTVFEQKKYDLCFECHESTVVRDEKTTALTNFRDGDQNLHYLHVNRTKGRTCRACHEIHAGDQPNHVREETPFGEWSLPIGFSKTETGGNCIPGCHKAYSYDRKKVQLQ